MAEPGIWIRVQLGLLLAFATIGFVVLKHIFRGQLRHLPGPTHTLFTHLCLKWATINGKKLHYIDDLHRRYGSIVRIAPHSVSINDIASTKQVYDTVKGFDKDLWYITIHPWERPGVFNTCSNKEASKTRRLLAPPLSNSAIHSNWEEVVRSDAALTVESILAEVKREGTADMLKWWILMANEIGCHVLFGEKMGQIEKGEKSDFIKDLEKTLESVIIMREFPLLAWIGKVLPFRNRFNIDGNLEYGQRAVDNAREAGTKANVFTGLVARAGEKSDDKLDEFSVVVNAFNSTLAASDTTAITMTYLVWLVIGHAAIREKLEQELAGLSDNFGDADLEKLPWLGSIINETLRLHGGVSSALPRMVPETGAVINGFHLPPGTTIGAQNYTIHRNPEIWDDPLKFDPERWIREQSPAEKIAFGAFGRGPRYCLGVHLARMELRYATALLFLAGVKDPSRRLNISPRVTSNCMVPEDFFITPPAAHRCEVVLA